jgi:predicted amidohydrolase YtcJ
MPLSPLYGVRAAMTHPTERERLSESDAVLLSTRACAEAFGSDLYTGALEPGMAADLCVLPESFRWEEASADSRTDLTMVAGRIVHESAAFASTPARGALA